MSRQRGLWIVMMVMVATVAGGVCWAADEEGVVEPPEARPVAAADEATTAPETQTQEPAAAPSAYEESAPSEEAVAAAPAAEAGMVSVDFKDADIRQVLRVISLKSGIASDSTI